MTDNKQFIAEMTPETFQNLQQFSPNYLIIVKFGAEWCKPCKLIKQTCEDWFNKCPSNISYADIDIDESMDLYMAFKRKKMARGVPIILAFNTNIQRDEWYIPDDSVEGGDIDAVNAFFQRCIDVSSKM